MPVTALIPLNEPTVIPGTTLRVTHHGPDSVVLLDVVTPDGKRLADLVLPPGSGLDPPTAVISYSNRNRGLVPPPVSGPLIEFDFFMTWDATGAAMAVVDDHTDLGGWYETG